jgi:hypothetical protein
MTITKLATIALSVLVASTGLATSTGLALADGVTLIDRPVYDWPTFRTDRPDQSHGFPTVECRVHNADVWIQNFGTDILDTGRQVAWRSPTTGDQGLILVPKILAPGEEVKIADALTADALAGAPCQAALV